MKVSIFHDMTCKLPLTGLLEGVANLIRTDEKLAVFTRSYRQTGSKTFKNESQLFAVPCLFDGGKGRSNIRQLTGMSLVDFDHVFPTDGTAAQADSNALQELKAKIIADPHTLMSYITMSGNGLRVIFTYEIAPEFSGVPKDEEEVKKFEAYYQQAFYAGNAYYEKLLGAKADMQCKNITRLSGLAHDPEVFLRPQSEVIPFTAEEISTAATAYVKQSKEDKQMQRIQTYFDTLIAPQLAKAKVEFRSGSHNDYVMRVGYKLAQTVHVKGGEQEQLLWHLYLKKWLVGMVASWLSDDVVNNVILVLIGEQGAYKTAWFNYLLPPLLKQYFYTKTNANRMSKDDILTLAQYALVCCEELDTMRPAELNQLKAAVTMPSIDERAAYAHYHEHRKHIASFCGTGNNTQFLSDPTGNRRWLPFEVESIVSPRDHPFHYEGIYSQALALYKSGFQYWFTKEEIQELNRHNKQFETPHLEHELVDLYFRRPTDSELGEFISVARALQMISNGISQKLSAVNVGRAFSDLGFKRVRTNSCRGFIVVCRTSEEIKAYQHRLLMDAKPDSEADAPF